MITLEDPLVTLDSTHTVATVDLGGKRIAVSLVHKDLYKRSIKAKVYGAVEVFPTAVDPTEGEFLYDEGTQPKRWSALTESGREHMNERLALHRSYRREALKQAQDGLRQIFSLPGMPFDTDGLSFTFDIYAGCSACPCSPGHRASGPIYDINGLPCDVFITAID